MATACGDAVSDAAFANNENGCRTANGGYSFFVIRGAPTATQITKTCASSACMAEIAAIKAAQPTECMVDSNLKLYGDILDPINAVCPGKNGSTPTATTAKPTAPTTPTVTTVPTPAPKSIVTAAPVTTAPVVPQATPKTESSGGSNVGMIAGIGAGVLAVALLVGFVVFRARRRSSTRYQRDSDENLSRPGKSEQAPGYNDMPTPSYPNHGQGGNTYKQTVSSHAPTASSQATSSTYSTNPATQLLWNDLDLDRVRLELEDIQVNETAVLGRGGFCEVLVARYEGHEVAVKRLLPTLRDDDEMQAMLLAEAKTMTALNHRQIVKLVGVAWHEPRDLCIVTELVRGTDMGKYIAHAKEHHAPPGFNTEKVLMALQIADALDYLHRQSPPVLHRDIKPANILVTDNYQAKLADFGVSRDNDATLKTTQIGTKYWMAPEQALSKKYDAKVDIFAFGVLLSELDTYEAPYSQSLEGRSMADAVFFENVRNGQLTVAFSGGPDDPVAQLGRECVRVHPRDRPSASDLFRRLQEILHEFQKRDEKRRVMETMF